MSTEYDTQFVCKFFQIIIHKFIVQQCSPVNQSIQKPLTPVFGQFSTDFSGCDPT